MRVGKAEILLLGALLSMGVAPAGFALSLPGGSSSNLIPLGPGGQVNGVCNTTQPIITESQLQNFESNLNSTVQQVGKAINTGQMQQMSSEMQTLNQKMQELVKSKKELLKFQARQKYTNQVSGVNASASACTQASGAGDTLNGLVSAQSSAARITASALSAEQPVTDPLQVVRSLAQASAPTLSASSLIPVGDTAATASAISAYIQHVVMPVVPQKITAAAESTAAGSQYRALKHLMDARSSLSTVTLGAIAKENLPETDDTLAKLYWQKAGLSGALPGDRNGKISQNGLLNAMSYRYLLGSYATGGAGTANHGDAWMLRQYAIEMSGQLHAELEEEQFLEHAVALQAAMLGAQVQKGYGKMNDLRAAAMQQAANQPAAGN